MTTDLTALLDACRAGDQRAREQLFSDLRVRLLPVAQYRLRNVSLDLIEDIVQNTLTSVFERIDDITSRPDSFALKTLRHKIGDFIRDFDRKVLSRPGTDDGSDDSIVALDNYADETPAPIDEQVAKQDLIERVRHALHAMTPMCQALFLAILEHRPVKEVWALFQGREPDLTRAAFDKRLFDCRRRLRFLFADSGDGGGQR